MQSLKQRLPSYPTFYHQKDLLSHFLCVCGDFGIHHGCPFSPLAFVLAIKLLAIKIRDAKYKRNKKLEFKQSILYIEAMTDLYADIILFLNDEDDMRYALNVIHKFSIFYGLEVNRTKSHTIILTHFFSSCFLCCNIIRKSCHLRF